LTTKPPTWAPIAPKGAHVTALQPSLLSKTFLTTQVSSADWFQKLHDNMIFNYLDVCGLKQFRRKTHKPKQDRTHREPKQLSSLQNNEPSRIFSFNKKTRWFVRGICIKGSPLVRSGFTVYHNLLVIRAWCQKNTELWMCPCNLPNRTFMAELKLRWQTHISNRFTLWCQQRVPVQIQWHCKLWWHDLKNKSPASLSNNQVGHHAAIMVIEEKNQMQNTRSCPGVLYQTRWHRWQPCWKGQLLASRDGCNVLFISDWSTVLS
jgi:hypothetical protein